MDEYGYAYVPKACVMQQCTIHVAFHGCYMGVESIGLDFVHHSGINEWAESNSIVVVYPQVIKTLVNPAGTQENSGQSEM